MKITSYHADGSILNTLEATRKEPCGKDFLPDHWNIWLENGKRITSSAERFDAHYPGWRDLPEIKGAA